MKYYLRYIPVFILVALLCISSVFAIALIYEYAFVPSNGEEGTVSYIKNSLLSVILIISFFAFLLMLMISGIVFLVRNYLLRREVFLEISEDGIYCIGCIEGIKIPWQEIDFLEWQKVNILGIYKIKFTHL